MKGKKTEVNNLCQRVWEPALRDAATRDRNLHILSQQQTTNKKYGLNCNYCWQTQTDREFHNFGHTTPPFPSRPGTTRCLLEIHGGRQQTKHFPQRQNKTLWLQQWPHNRPSSNGPFAFRWKERNEVIWTCGPNGGAAVKHLTIKQLNCAAAVSLSRKLIQRAVRMIPFIRDEKSHAPQPEYLHSEPKRHSALGIVDQTVKGKIKKALAECWDQPWKKCPYLPVNCVQLLCPMVWPFRFFKEDNPLGSAFTFFLVFSRTSHYCCLVPGDRISKKATAGLTDRTRYDLLWGTDEPNKEQMSRQ